MFFSWCCGDVVVCLKFSETVLGVILNVGDFQAVVHSVLTFNGQLLAVLCADEYGRIQAVDVCHVYPYSRLFVHILALACYVVNV